MVAGSSTWCVTCLYQGAREREQCYKPIIDAVEKRYGAVSDKYVWSSKMMHGRYTNNHHPFCRSTVAICVPGAGLGRLTFEFARRGYRSQGNEWSVHMLLASNTILNKSVVSWSSVNCRFTPLFRFPGTFHTLVYPWAHLFVNNYSDDDQVKPCCAVLCTMTMIIRSCGE